MAHLLQNENLAIQIDEPLENYRFSRFDWTGKIVEVKFQGTPMSTIERTDGQNEHLFGKAFYNEFGIETALGFEETEIGGWFHKIGVGLLKKEDVDYLFSKPYEIEPAEFESELSADRLLTVCKSRMVNGYAYVLKKEIALHDNGFVIHYALENTGEKDLVTDEYVHNFMATDREPIGTDYQLILPFPLNPELFGDTVNPGNKVEIGHHTIGFNGPTPEQFFFSFLNGNNPVEATWELINLKSRLGIRETGSFQTDKVNLWGWEHVISPELFHRISVGPGESAKWSRRYDLFKVK